MTSCAEYARLSRIARPIAAEAIRAVQIAVEEGKLLPASKAGPCVDCGRPGRCWDHRDYRRPLDVELVCLSCNRKRGTAEPYRGAPSVTGGPQRQYRKKHDMRAFIEGRLA